MDPNDEYLGLFIDRCTEAPEEITYIHIGSDSLHNNISRALGNNSPDPSPEILQIMKQQLRLPPPLQEMYVNDESFKNRIDQGLTNVFHRTKIVLPFEDVATLIRKVVSEQTDERTGVQVKEAMRQVLDNWANGYIDQPLNHGTITNAIDFAQNELNRKPFEDLTSSTKGTAEGILARSIRTLNREAMNLAEIPSDAIISIDNLIERVSDRKKRQTVIITGRRDSDIKHFASLLGNNVYEKRRHMTTRKPFITFIFDEADLFIPQTRSDDDTLSVRELCVTLARRGRKFGLGLGISTQRSSMLDTEVMSNLHTYFVSKLPRSDDRKRVAEAFGISEEQLTPTFTFRRGNWLVISHDATGLKGVPIPTTATDANERISGDKGA